MQRRQRLLQHTDDGPCYMEKMIEYLYEQFLLRDFFGKVTGGFIFLASLLFCGWYEAAETDFLQAFRDVSFFPALLLLALCWLAGLALQSLGSRCIRIKSTA